MNAYQLKRYLKVILLLTAMAIGTFSLIYSNRLVKKLSIEEEKKIALFGKAQEQYINAETEEEQELCEKILKDNTTIPVIWVNQDGVIAAHRNLDSVKAKNPDYVREQLEGMKSDHPPIVIESDNVYNYVYYDDSTTLKQLRRYPFYQLGIVALFMLVSYFAFSYSRRAEQNQVWVGLAKETAHQLGTPMSSLMAWVDLIELDKEQATPEALEEMRKDLDRLRVITERFSKIGSTPVMHKVEFEPVLQKSIDYMKTRSSEKVIYQFENNTHNLYTELNIPLFEWVIENLCKNAIDAMNGVGLITLRLRVIKDKIVLDISDTGKGIPHNLFKTIFKPGFTTKKRGWGLGLSLVKRIIENYHKGHIFVKESTPNKKTTFRIVLKSC